MRKYKVKGSRQQYWNKVQELFEVALALHQNLNFNMFLLTQKQFTMIAQIFE
jgi:hypothetical protein